MRGSHISQSASEKASKIVILTERLRRNVGSYQIALESGGHWGLKISEGPVCVACVADSERQSLLVRKQETYLAISWLATLADDAGSVGWTMKLWWPHLDGNYLDHRELLRSQHKTEMPGCWQAPGTAAWAWITSVETSAQGCQGVHLLTCKGWWFPLVLFS